MKRPTIKEILNLDIEKGDIILTGKFKPSGKLPFALAENAEAIVKQDPDAPGYGETDTLFPFGYGLSY